MGNRGSRFGQMRDAIETTTIQARPLTLKFLVVRLNKPSKS
jgi:hypothetical protein